MLLPEPPKFNPDPNHIRSIIRQLGLTNRQAAHFLKMRRDSFERKLRGKRKFSYEQQVFFERMLEDARKLNDGIR